MATWLLDTNIVLYLLTREDQLRKAREVGPEAEAHLRSLYEALDRFLAERLAAGDRFLLTPVVVLETLNVLQYAEAFGMEAKQAAEAVLGLVLAEELDCEEPEWVVSALQRQAAGEAPFADAYLARRAQEGGVYLLTNDRELWRMAQEKGVLLRELVAGPAERGKAGDG